MLDSSEGGMVDMLYILTSTSKNLDGGGRLLRLLGLGFNKRREKNENEQDEKDEEDGRETKMDEDGRSRYTVSNFD